MPKIPLGRFVPPEPLPVKGYVLSGAPCYSLSWSPEPEPCFSSSPHLHPWVAFGTHLIKGVPEAQQEEHVFLHMVGEWLAEGLAQRGAHRALRDPRGQ